MSTASFPLFQSLFDDTLESHNDSFPSDYQEFILQHITDLDENGREIFYAIIRQDQIKKSSNVTADSLPTCCKQMKSGIRIDFDKIPNAVKHMLHSFIKKYLKKLNEDATFFANVPK